MQLQQMVKLREYFNETGRTFEVVETITHTFRYGLKNDGVNLYGFP
jgi:hypothetical protein